MDETPDMLAKVSSAVELGFAVFAIIFVALRAEKMGGDFFAFADVAEDEWLFVFCCGWFTRR